MSVKDKKLMATTEMRMVRWAMGVSLLEHRRNEEILEEAKVEAIATVMRRRKLEWFGHVKRRGETENIRAVAEMQMEGKRPRGRPKLRWKDTIRRDLKAWKIKEEWATDREKWKGLCKTRYPEQGDGGERWESEKWMYIFAFIWTQNNKCFWLIIIYSLAQHIMPLSLIRQQLVLHNFVSMF